MLNFTHMLKSLDPMAKTIDLTYLCIQINNTILFYNHTHIKLIKKSKTNKKCFRNIYAPHGAKFRLIFSVEAKPVRSK